MLPPYKVTALNILSREYRSGCNQGKYEETLVKLEKKEDVSLNIGFVTFTKDMNLSKLWEMGGKQRNMMC